MTEMKGGSGIEPKNNKHRWPQEKIHEQIKWRLAILLIVCLDDFHSKAEAHSEIRLLEFKRQ